MKFDSPSVCLFRTTKPMLNSLRQLFHRQTGQAENPFLSPHGGFWTDRRDALDEVDSRLRGGSIDAHEADQLRFWIANGFLVIPDVLDAAVVEAVQQAIDEAIDAGSRQMTYWDEGGKYQGPARRDKLAAAECKVIDVHANLLPVQQAVFAPKLARFFELVMGSKALAFQTLYFEHGSEQGVHQDTAFVYVKPALEFMASWIALEDIQTGSGELLYYPGSHRLPDRLFGSPPGKALLPDDPEAAGYSAELAARCQVAGLSPQSFLPRRGDALIWAADLVHGGSARRGPLTRRSLVTHYCPLHRRPPYGSSARPQLMPSGHGLLSQT